MSYIASQASILRVRINNIDHTLDRSYSGTATDKAQPLAPVLRVFGDSSLGKNACVNIHGVYPYVYVDYSGEMNSHSVREYITKLKHNLNHAMNKFLKRTDKRSEMEYIHKIILVKGVPFYGFHAAYAPYLKIYILDPSRVRRIVEVLQGGSVMKTTFAVYEAHTSFLLQFMSDFGLYGCGWLNLGEEIYERAAEEDQMATAFQRSSQYRQSRLPLEFDVHAHQILNRHLITARDIHHKLEIPEPPLPNEPLISSVRELWEDERSRRRAKGLAPTPDIPGEPSADSRGSGGDWVAEVRWWAEFNRRIEKERKEIVISDGEEAEWTRSVMSTFQSVEALWDSKHRTWKPHKEDPQAEALNNSPPTTPTDETGVDLDVDVSMLPLDDIDQREAAEWQRMGLLDEASEEKEEEDNAEENFSDQEQEEKDEGPPPAATDLELQEEGPPPDEQSDIINDIEVDEPASGNPSTPPRSPNKTFLSPQTVRLMTVPRAERMIKLHYTQITETPDKEHNSSQDIDSPKPTLSKRKPSLHVTPKDIQTPDRSAHELLEQARKSLKPLKSLAQAVQSGTPRASLRWNETSFSTRSMIENGSLRTLKKRKISARVSFVLPEPTISPAPEETNAYVLSRDPPVVSELRASGELQGIAPRVYRAPHYSDIADAPERSWEFGGLQFMLKGGSGLHALEEWQKSETEGDDPMESIGVSSGGSHGWEYASAPPSFLQAKRWLVGDAEEVKKKKREKLKSQIGGPTLTNIYGFKGTLGAPSESAVRERQSMTVLSMELFAPSRGELVPDPSLDEIKAIFYTFQGPSTNSDEMTLQTGVLAVDEPQLKSLRLRDFHVIKVKSELDLINDFIDIVIDLDPDIISGWEIQSASWGYLENRGLRYELDISNHIGRAPSQSSGKTNSLYAAQHSSSIRCVGRHVLNLWRIMRAEQSLTTYTFENTVFHLLHQRVPKYSYKTLTDWYNSPVAEHSARVFRYHQSRTSMVLDMLETGEVITKNAEFARVFGIDFFDVIRRGSQYKVESFMFRLAKPESFVLVSPSAKEVGAQNAAECIPLIMEPNSAFYSSPLVVLDFASLYPSIMIAYNYCYSTCLGRVTEFQSRMKFGVLPDMRYPPGFLENLQDHVTIAPNGIMFVKSNVRKGLLGRMLTELLDTRVMVKQAMKGVKSDKALSRILDARQLSLKFIANVTYGYTSASFSGRMPAVEVADSIVQSGRETLEKAIRVIDEHPSWGAKVVYGDTDSMFIYLLGKTKDQAFRIGHEMANAVTAMNPVPIKLKFEKVYFPCLLMAKKRYVGFKYENPDDMEPVFDAKGIETVRRDGTAAQRKNGGDMYQDLSQIKEYCYDSWTKILSNKAALDDFIFAKEVKLGTYGENAPPGAGAVVAALRSKKDPNAEPQYAERVSYIVTQTLGRKSNLNERAMDPLDMLKHKNLQIDAQYYINNVLIPPLARIFNLVGADVKEWYKMMPKPMQAELPPDPQALSPRRIKLQAVDTRLKIHEHFKSSTCLLCGSLAFGGICEDCKITTQVSISGLLERIRAGEEKILDVQKICTSCTSLPSGESMLCESLDCSWFFERRRIENKGEFVQAIREVLDELLESEGSPHVASETEDAVFD